MAETGETEALEAAWLLNTLARKLLDTPLDGTEERTKLDMAELGARADGEAVMLERTLDGTALDGKALDGTTLALLGTALDGLNKDDTLATTELTAEEMLEIRELAREETLESRLLVAALLAAALETALEAAMEENRLDMARDDGEGTADALENPGEDRALEISKLDDAAEE